MVAVSEMSAYEVYQLNNADKRQENAARLKEKRKRKIAKRKQFKLNTLAASELLEAASEHSKRSSGKDAEQTAVSGKEPMITIVEAPKKTKLNNGSVKEKKKTSKSDDSPKSVQESNQKSSGAKRDSPTKVLSVAKEDSSSIAKGNRHPAVSSKAKKHASSPAQSMSGSKASESESVSLSGSESSVQIAENFFSWLMDPISKEDFFSLYWEKRPVHIGREENRDYYSGLLSTAGIDAMLRKNNILYGKNIDITSYTNQKRETLNSTGRAHAAVVWDYYRNGCSIRLLNPQTYHAQLRELNTRLQEVFGSFVGSNAYLTPPNSQGFAPHYDDIEAFVLQIEGSKMWRVYAPRDASETLPRTSSPNFTQEEIGEPLLEVHLKAGDILYFPRGFIHQANTVPGEHSLHVTISAYQRNSWADLLEKLVPAALSNAIDEDEDFRKGMPLDVLNHLGAVHSDSESPERKAIMKKLKRLFSKLFDYAPVDAASDQLAKDYIHGALPPCLSSAEKKCSVLENSDRMKENGQCQGAVILALETPLRLTRSNVLRLVSEEEPDCVKLYHSMENSLEYHGEDIQWIEIPVHFAPAVEHLILSYPKFTPIYELPLENDADKIQLATELWERALVLTQEPLPVRIDDGGDVDDEDSDDDGDE
ncbi:ribosomal oxygenase 1-like [Thrips palmi]|uniref:Bifunctional lysine-specific demethylase and histidyl-hydroxylase n=1 Tax=Thrips palmi TaxID=161013 RepID=A0A6P9AFG3_THRPL|nr:ribosomal oxygenase 1-like [Thrips palmi]XP_034257112.1 ribosomal oxygenase 1-like [Thrips palmi]XP_034257121.1 ribosomal oxygenase 1-like [Thrips palmi]